MSLLSPDGTTESVDKDWKHCSTHHGEAGEKRGDLYIYDVQAYHEGVYRCTVDNGRDHVTSHTVNVTIIGKRCQMYLTTAGVFRTISCRHFDIK